MAELLSYLEPAAVYCRRIFQHANETTPNESAQKTLAANLVIQAFRTSAGSIQLSLAGYADIAATVVRSLWEIQLQLEHVRNNGELIALASIFASINREIKLRQQIIASEGNAADRENLDTWLVGRADIVGRAASLGCNESDLLRLGKTTLATRASSAALTSEYEGWYIPLSQMSHGARAFATYHALMPLVPQSSSILLPVDDDIETMVCFALEHLYRSIAASALIFDDWRLAAEVKQTHTSLAAVISRVIGEAA